MQEVMDSVVNIAQSAFIKGRSIHDAIMLVQQLIQQHSADSVAGGLLFVDFAHAYDYIICAYGRIPHVAPIWPICLTLWIAATVQVETNRYCT